MQLSSTQTCSGSCESCRPLVEQPVTLFQIACPRNAKLTAETPTSCKAIHLIQRLVSILQQDLVQERDVQLCLGSAAHQAFVPTCCDVPVLYSQLIIMTRSTLSSKPRWDTVYGLLKIHPASYKKTNNVAYGVRSITIPSIR